LVRRRELSDSRVLYYFVKIPLTFTGVLIAVVAVSLVSGGFVIYANHVAVALASTPILVLVVRALVILTTCAPIAYLLYKVPLGLLKGLVSTLFAFFTVYAIAAAELYLVVVLCAAGITLAATQYRARRQRAQYSIKPTVFKPYLLLIPLLIAYATLSTYALKASSEQVELVELREPIEVSADQHLVPLLTAYTYAAEKLQVPTHSIRLEDVYVYFSNSRSVYSWIIEPSGFWNQVTKTPMGFVMVYGDVYPPRVETILKNTTWGLRNMKFYGLFFDSLYRQVVLRVGLHYKPLLESSVKIVHNGELLVLIPVVKWERGLVHSAPLLHGYVAVHEDGSLEFISAESALRDPRFQGLPVVPWILAREWAKLREHSISILGFYSHRGVYVVRDVGAEQPYLLVGTSNKTWWVFVAEPQGEPNTTKYLVYVDPSSLKPVLYVYTLPTPVVSAGRAVELIKQHYSLLDWNRLVIEGLAPIFVNNTLYWRAVVTTRDYRELVFVALVNAETGAVTAVDVSKLSVELRGNLTAKEVLELLIRAVRGEVSEATIEERIKYLEELIQQLKATLDQLERELEELKRQVGRK